MKHLRTPITKPVQPQDEVPPELLPFVHALAEMLSAEYLRGQVSKPHRVRLLPEEERGK